MSVYKVRIHATVTETYRVIAENEQEAASKAELMFRNNQVNEILAMNFEVRFDNFSHQSCYVPSRGMRYWGSQRQVA